MPWREVLIVDERREFVRLAMTHLARRATRYTSSTRSAP